MVGKKVLLQGPGDAGVAEKAARIYECQQQPQELSRITAATDKVDMYEWIYEWIYIYTLSFA